MSFTPLLCACGEKYVLKAEADLCRERKCPDCGQPLNSAAFSNSQDADRVAHVATRERIQFRCPKCKKKLQAPRKAMGKTIECPGCSTKLAIPGNSHATPKMPAPSNDY